jgi:hypothetical protein
MSVSGWSCGTSAASATICIYRIKGWIETPQFDQLTDSLTRDKDDADATTGAGHCPHCAWQCPDHGLTAPLGSGVWAAEAWFHAAVVS